ncbi:hypothetical protein M758_3G237300 [Ceratodon purpureus]|nr:hypothetical protein M758_3G237300 [Ceratodon purpureus]
MAQLDIRWLFSWWKSVNDVPVQQGADELLNLCKGIIGKTVQHLGAKRDGGRYLMNSHQCEFLVKRLLETQGTLADYQQLLLDLDEKAIPALQELHQALVNAERLIQSSCIKDTEWLRAAIEQGDMKETFSTQLYEVQWHKFVLQSILVDNFGVSGIIFQPALCYGELTERDKLGLASAMKEDEWLLKTRLKAVIHTLDDPIEEALADQFLKKMEAVDDQLTSVSFEGSYQLLKNREAIEQSTKDPNGVGLDTSSSLNLLFLNPQNLNDYYCGTLLGRGSFAEVRETTLLGGKCAIKIFEQHHTHSFDQEVAALQGLGNHPHIVHLFCYSKNSSKCFLIMEKMDMDLSQFLQLRKDNEDRVVSDVDAVVLMLQIAEGVRYIHSKRMAHRDLKPGNVLLNVDDDPSSKFLCRARSVKIADFGLTKTKNASVAKADHTLNTGTLRYMAPEVINAPGIIEARGDSDRSELIPKKADVYSFAIMCCEILTGENAFGNLPNNELKKHVKAGEGPMSRPNLPKCPERLASLIRRCWIEDLYERPDFDEICVELRDIKGMLLRGDRQKSQTKDVVIEFGSVSAQRTQEFKMPSSQGTTKRRLSSFVSKQPLGLRDVRRCNWTSQIWSCRVVLVFPLFLLLSLGATSYHAKQHQVPWEHNIDVKERSQSHDVAVSMKGIKQGPWGRKEPNKITGFFDHKADSIKSIMLKYDQNPPRVGLMEVEYVNSDGGEFKKRYCWDTVGSKVIKIDFEPNEHIKRVSGSVALYFMEVRNVRKVGLYSVVSLTFHTNLRSYGPYGDEVGERFTSGTGKVIGFFGAAGVLLDKLGVWIIPDGEFDGDQSVLIEQ